MITAPETRRSQLLDFYNTISEGIGSECLKIAYAGGLRRFKPDPHDIEIVVLPIWDTNLFGERAETHVGIDAKLDALVQKGVLEWDTKVPRNGVRYKRFVIPSLDNFPCEIFFADEQNWGNILTIRTGDADFSRLLVTPIEEGGLMPFGMRQIDGYLRSNGLILPCVTEREFFARLGVEWVPPRERHMGSIVRLRRELCVGESID